MEITAHDRKKAAQIIQRLTPPDRLYAKYVRAAEEFIRHFHPTKTKASQNQKIHRLEMLASKCFGKSYLVAFVDRDWFHQIAPACDAAASSALTHLGRLAPPLVILPGKSISRKRGFASILEHEIVHVNQGIVGELPNLDSCKLENSRIFKELMRYTLMEYEAHFVQLAHDSTLAPPEEYGFGLEKWCHLRGFTCGLETVISRMMKADYPEIKFMRFVRKLESDLPVAFKQLGFSEDMGQAFASDLDRLLNIAIHNVERGSLGL